MASSGTSLLHMLQVPLFSVLNGARGLPEEPVHVSIELDSSRWRSSDELVAGTEARAHRITPPHTKTLRRLFTFEAPTNQFYYSAYSSHFGLKGSGDSIVEQRYSTSEELLRADQSGPADPSPLKTTRTQPSATEALQLRAVPDKLEREDSSGSSSGSKQLSSESSSISEHTVSDHRSVNRFADGEEKERARVSTRASSNELIQFWKKPKFIFGSLQNLSEDEELLDPWIIEDQLPFRKLKPKFLQLAAHRRRQSRPLDRLHRILYRCKSLPGPAPGPAPAAQAYCTLQSLEEDVESGLAFLKAALRRNKLKKPLAIAAVDRLFQPPINEFGWLGLTQWAAISTRPGLQLRRGDPATRGRPALLNQQTAPRVCLA
jgi:hypothetical protein